MKVIHQFSEFLVLIVLDTESVDNDDRIIANILVIRVIKNSVRSNVTRPFIFADNARVKVIIAAA